MVGTLWPILPLLMTQWSPWSGARLVNHDVSEEGVWRNHTHIFDDLDSQLLTRGYILPLWRKSDSDALCCGSDSANGSDENRQQFHFLREECIREYLVWGLCWISASNPQFFIGAPLGPLLFQVDSGGCMGTALSLIIIKFVETSLKWKYIKI